MLLEDLVNSDKLGDGSVSAGTVDKVDDAVLNVGVPPLLENSRNVADTTLLLTELIGSRVFDACETPGAEELCPVELEASTTILVASDTDSDWPRVKVEGVPTGLGMPVSDVTCDGTGVI